LKHNASNSYVPCRVKLRQLRTTTTLLASTLAKDERRKALAVSRGPTLRSREPDDHDTLPLIRSVTGESIGAARSLGVVDRAHRWRSWFR